MAETFTDTEQFEGACYKALELDANNLKVLYRRATARVNFGMFAEAEADIRRGLELEPASKEFKALHVQLQNKVKKQKAEEKKQKAEEKKLKNRTIYYRKIQLHMAK